MASKQNTSTGSQSCSQDMSVTTCHYDEQYENQYVHGQLILCNQNARVVSNVTDSQPAAEYLSSQHYHSLRERQSADIGFATPIDISTAEQPCLTVRSIDELQILQKLHENRLQHQLREESLKHVVTVKKLLEEGKQCDGAPKLSPLSPSTITASHASQLPTQSVNPASVSNGTSMSGDDCSSERIILSCPLQVELYKKLQLQRIQQQIEIEEAVHNIKMKGLTET